MARTRQILATRGNMKRIYYVNETDLEGQRWVARVLDFSVSLMVAAAINEMHSTYAFLAERPDLMKGIVKRCCNMAFREATHTHCQIKSVMKSKKFWLDYSDAVIDVAEADVGAFRTAVRHILDDAHIGEAEIISYIETTRVLLAMTVNQFNGVMESARKRFGRDYSNVFQEYRMDRTKYWWDAMCDMLYKCTTIGLDIDLNNDETAATFDNMCEKFVKGSYIQACQRKAQANNPDFIENDIEIVN